MRDHIIEAKESEIVYLRNLVEFFKSELDKSQARRDELQKLLLRDAGLIPSEAIEDIASFKPLQSGRKSWKDIRAELQKKDREAYQRSLDLEKELLDEEVQNA